MAGLTLDSGALIALERGDPTALRWIARALERGVVPRVPAVVVAETWRGGKQARIAALLHRADVVGLDGPQARRAGELLAAVGGRNAVDAIVAVAAADTGGTLLTSDAEDLEPLMRHLGRGRVERV